MPELSKRKWYPGKENELINKIRKTQKGVIIFGAGYFGERLLNLCNMGGNSRLFL